MIETETTKNMMTETIEVLPLQLVCEDGYTIKGVARLDNTNRLLITGGRSGDDRYKAVIVMMEDSTEVWVMDTTVMTCGHETCGHEDWSHHFKRIFHKMGEQLPTQITVLDPRWDSCFPLGRASRPLGY